MYAVLFDLDGTLLDSKRTILRCLNTALQEFGFETFGDDDLYSLIGMHLMEILELKGANRPEVAEKYTIIQLETYQQDMTVYDGASSLLKRLHDSKYKLAAVTMRRSHIALAVISGMGLGDYFDEVVGADEVSEPKPSAEHTLTACRGINTPPERCIMVGDSKFDMLSAKSAGCTAVGVTWGMGSTRELYQNGADHIVDDFDELYELIIKIKDKREVGPPSNRKEEVILT